MEEGVGKREPAVAANAAVSTADGTEPPLTHQHRLFVTDRRTKMKFLVDSGADVSLIPAGPNDQIDTSYELYAANGTPIPTYGLRVVQLDLGLRRQFQWTFIAAKVTKGIIGADFLYQFGLLVDIRNKELVDKTTSLRVHGTVMAVTDFITTVSLKLPVSELLAQYPDITTPTLIPTNLKHGVEHFITTEGAPVAARPRPLDPQRMAIAKKEFQFMLDHGIVRPSSSQWASPLHMVAKKNGDFRPCGDYRRLNERTVPDMYPVPRVEDFQTVLQGTSVFSKIDLCKAYYQVPIAECDKHKTAITTPFGLYEFNVMSFGLRNAPATFMRFVHEVFRGLPFVFSYLDDTLVASSDMESHRAHLREVFDRLSRYGLRINVSKSVFAVKELEFLGYLIQPEGTRPLPSKVKAIAEYKRPETIQQLRTFLGMLNFYRPYLPNAAEAQSVLQDYLKGAKKKDNRPVPWTDHGTVQFEACKQAIIDATMLSYRQPQYPLALFTDASDLAIGSVVQQYDGQAWQPLAFYSKKLSPAQKNYSVYDKELLGIYLSLKHFQHILEAQQFCIFTDHRPLTFAFNKSKPVKVDRATSRQIRQLQYISQFSTDIRHVSGSSNVVADFFRVWRNSVLSTMTRWQLLRGRTLTWMKCSSYLPCSGASSACLQEKSSGVM